MIRSDSPRILIVGLGNPGKQYQNSRHNAGELLINHIINNKLFSRHIQTSRSNSSLPLRLFVSLKINQTTVYLALLDAYMNESGFAAMHVARYYRIDPKDIIAAHDDIDIPLGQYRLQFDRGPAGHNGVQSLIDAFDTKAFHRMRIGIGPSPIPDATRSFVLGTFPKESLHILESEVFPLATQDIYSLVGDTR